MAYYGISIADGDTSLILDNWYATIIKSTLYYWIISAVWSSW